MLDVQEVSVRFGGVVALDGLSFGIDRGQICALIGPNGAGKTTLFNVISRLYEPTTGSVAFDGDDLLRLPPHRIAEIGIARTFQNLALVPGLIDFVEAFTSDNAFGPDGYLVEKGLIPLSDEDRTAQRVIVEGLKAESND